MAVAELLAVELDSVEEPVRNECQVGLRDDPRL